MLRHLAQPLHAAVLVLRISRKAHFDSPPIIVRIRSVTPFNSASISASVAGRLEDVEMAVERDLVADLRLLVVDPGIRGVRQDFPLEVGFDRLAQRHVLGVAQAGIGLGLALRLALGAEHDLARSRRAAGRSTVIVR